MKGIELHYGLVDEIKQIENTIDRLTKNQLYWAGTAYQNIAVFKDADWCVERKHLWMDLLALHSVTENNWAVL